MTARGHKLAVKYLTPNVLKWMTRKPESDLTNGQKEQQIKDNCEVCLMLPCNKQNNIILQESEQLSRLAGNQNEMTEVENLVSYANH